MPVYDHNGNVLSEVSRIYDHDGTALSQIGKVYDNDGTADRLIYSSEFVVIGDNREYTSGWATLPSTNYANRGQITDYVDSVIQYTEGTNFTNYAGAGNAGSVVPIDLSGYSTLYFTTSNAYYFEYAIVGVSRRSDIGAYRGSDHLYEAERYIKVTANGTYSIDVSDLIGSYYIYLGLVANYTSSNLRGHVYYSNMYLV